MTLNDVIALILR